MNNNMTNKVLWIVYLSLLAVLLPHTAWAFQQFEPARTGWYIFDNISLTAWLAALAFEAAIAALTHKLSEHIEATKKGLKGRERFVYQYLNAYSIGLILSLCISSMANLAHAVQFGWQIKIFTDWKVPFGVYAFVFGAVLPLISYLFARVLSNETEQDAIEDPQLLQLRQDNSNLRKQLRDSQASEAAIRARLDAMGDVFVRLMSEDKKTRILAAAERWPKLPGSSIATITDTSGAYVSEVLSK